MSGDSRCVKRSARSIPTKRAHPTIRSMLPCVCVFMLCMPPMSYMHVFGEQRRSVL